MLILAIETSGREGSVAILQDARPCASQLLESGRTAQDLAPAVDQLCRQLGIRPSDLELIAVSSGPGSFTGLRVGIATAKTLAYALGCGLLGIDSLDAVAARVSPAVLAVHNAAADAADLHAVVDAQRQELFVGRFRLASTAVSADPSPWERQGSTSLLPASEWLAQLRPNTVVAGAGLKRLLARIPAGIILAPEERWQPTAEAIGALAFADWQRGRRDNPFQLTPTYIRPSYAEDKGQSHA